MRRKKIVGPLSDYDSKGRRHALGVEGERLAATHLERRGLTVLDRNWRCPQGELDIVATDGDTVVCCEVKARSGVDYGGPLYAVAPEKINRIRNVARAWLAARQLVGCRVRFDVVSVLWPPGERACIKHLEGVF
ncbi:YraN family protein [Saccharopolyspora sp. K220]|uniref:YraN family protein n=1 Tax=Saccharopolyspora soli TaxID=2926618 RepID=UPI001F5A651D|nr:YraN family protein [Saccharopolyspora soli]MCI2419210.1 YraN family protein [Saccharopolyspora soli]